MSITLSRLSEGGKGLPCCGLASLSMITQTPLPIIYMHYKAKHDKPDQWRGATSFYYILDMLKEYQVDYNHISRKHMDKGRTLENYLADNPNLYALILTRGHLQVVVGDHVYDQGGVKHVSEHFGRNKYICDVVQIKSTNLGKDSLAYRALLLVTHGVCLTMDQANDIYKQYERKTSYGTDTSLPVS